jgi:hypothetical protein
MAEAVGCPCASAKHLDRRGYFLDWRQAIIAGCSMIMAWLQTRFSTGAASSGSSPWKGGELGLHAATNLVRGVVDRRLELDDRCYLRGPAELLSVAQLIAADVVHRVDGIVQPIRRARLQRGADRGIPDHGERAVVGRCEGDPGLHAGRDWMVVADDAVATGAAARRPLYPAEPTSSAGLVMSVKCHEQTFRRGDVPLPDNTELALNGGRKAASEKP